MKGLMGKACTILLTVVLLLGVSALGLAAPLIYSLPIHGEIEPGLAAFVARGLAMAERNNGAILLEVNTFGGRVDAATEIKDLLLKSDVPIYAYVSERAWSAGALITLAAPKIAMAPGSSIGAAEPRPMEEKTVSALRAEFESTAERNGKNGKLAGAMVDASVSIDGLVEQGKILTLSAQEAKEWDLADLIADSRYEVLQNFGYEAYELVELTPHWAEQIARFLTTSTVSSLLLTLGFLGLIVEITTPGWGVPGTGGILALLLFFGGRYITGLVGFEVLGLFILGFILLALEIFVVPGFGVVGLSGLAAILISIILAFGNLQLALASLSLAVSVSILALVFLWKRIGKSRFWQRIILSHTESKEEGYRAPADYTHLIGSQGRTLSSLRPAGTVLIGEDRYDVVSNGGFISVNSHIEVIASEGTRLVVREVLEEG